MNLISKIKSGSYLCVYDNYHALIALLSDFLIIGLAVYLAEYSFYIYPLTLLIIGSRQRALATILHESAHRTLAKNKTPNRILGTYFSGYLVAPSWQAYTKSHVIRHHVNLGNPKIDPDFMHYINSGIFDESKKKSFIWSYLVKPLTFLNVLQTIRYLFINRLLVKGNAQEFFKIALSLGVFALIGTIFVGWQFFILYWLVPYLTTFQLITWFIELAEHYPLVAKAKYDIEATRNRFSHIIEAFFTSMHAENFHLVHHLFPGVPFWNMKKAHQVLMEDKGYAEINASFGGIFISSNYMKPKWQVVLSSFNINTSY